MLNISTLNKAWFAVVLFLLQMPPAQSAMSRPNMEEGQATEIKVIGAILDIDKIDSAEQNFTLNLYTIFSWIDLRLAHDNEGSVIHNLSDVWNPRITIINTQQLRKNTRDEIEVSPAGEVTYRLHVFGDFSQPMDLREFPKDGHIFEVPVVAAGYRDGEVIFVPVKGKESFIAEKLSVADWHVTNMQGASREVTLSNGIKLPGFTFSFEAERRVHHFVVKMIIPLSLIVMMSWVVFWIDPKQVTNQLSVAVTTVLTLIAYHIALSGRLPEIPYLTRMDKFLFSTTLLVFLSLIEVVVTSHFSSTNRLELARKIDQAARWFFPFLFIIASSASLYA